jgi:hypothetical protein
MRYSLALLVLAALPLVAQQPRMGRRLEAC